MVLILIQGGRDSLTCSKINQDSFSTRDCSVFDK
jgi:hypothetical protein